mmetsp:Transcript_45971/g.68410  ORF Transcript_45971/g.68410 Transcript_45971/m.68410 type:complete len:217 (+) Transcript_45971:411-1061(+)
MTMEMGRMNSAMVIVQMTHVASRTVIHAVNHPTPINRTNILAACMARDKMIPKQISMNCQNQRNVPVMKDPSASMRASPPYSSITASAPDVSILNNPNVDILPKILITGTMNVMTESTISSSTGMHLASSSAVVRPPKRSMENHDARSVSTPPVMLSMSGFDFSIIPTRNKVRNGETPVLPPTTKETAVAVMKSKRPMMTEMITYCNRRIVNGCVL